MTRWPRGEVEIEQLIHTKALQRVAGAQADGTHLIEKATRTLATAAEISDRDPDSAFVLERSSPPAPTCRADLLPGHLGAGVLMIVTSGHTG